MRNSTVLILGIWVSGFSGCDRTLDVEQNPSRSEVGGQGNTTLRATGGGLVWTGGSFATGGFATVGTATEGTSTDPCASRTAETCRGECRQLWGYVDGSDAEHFVFVECYKGGGYCPMRVICAHPPGDSRYCSSFNNGCIPSGWVETLECDLPGCPPNSGERGRGENGGAANGGAANGGAANGGATQEGRAGDGSLLPLGSGGFVPVLDGGFAGMTGKPCQYISQCAEGEYCFARSLGTGTGTTEGVCVSHGTAESCQNPTHLEELCGCLDPAVTCPAGTVCGLYGPYYSQLSCVVPSISYPSSTPLRCHTHADCTGLFKSCYVPEMVENCEGGPLGYCVQGATAHFGINFAFLDCGADLIGPLPMPRFSVRYRSTGGDARCLSCSAPTTSNTGGAAPVEDPSCPAYLRNAAGTAGTVGCP